MRKIESCEDVNEGEDQSTNESVGNVSSGGFTRADDFHNLAPFQPQISGHRIAALNFRQLDVFQLISGQQFRLLVDGEDDVFRNQLVLGDVDEQLGLQELFEDVLGRHVDERLLRRRRHPVLDDDDRPRDVLFLHALTIRFDRLYADLGFLRKENEHLVCRIIVMRDQDYQIVPRWTTFRRLVPELSLKLLYRLVELILRNQIASIVTKLHDSFSYLP